MKIAFISPKWEKFPHWAYHLPQLGPLTVAGMTPPDNEVVYIDEFVTPVDFGLDADLIAVTAMTAQAGRAYEIADGFREAGKKVVIGGIHPTLLPEEALQHADTVIVGEAESIWQPFLVDFAAGRAKPVYTAMDTPGEFCVSGRFPRRDLLQVEGYSRTFAGERAIDTIQTTRGCIYDCEHCNVPSTYGRKLRSRPQDDVMEEMAVVEAKNVFVVDNLIYENRSYFMKLMDRMAGIEKKWIGVGTLKMADDKEFLDAIARGGCAFLYVGFDHLYENTYQSIRSSGLPGHYKDDVKIHDFDYRQDHVALADKYMKSVRTIQDKGIGVFGTFAFGFDNDDDGIFERTIDFALGADLALADFAIVTPYPKSPLHNRLEREGRIIDRDWKHYNGCHAVFEPKNMSAAALLEGWNYAWDRFYGHKTVLRRLVELFLPKNFKGDRQGV